MLLLKVIYLEAENYLPNLLYRKECWISPIAPFAEFGSSTSTPAKIWKFYIHEVQCFETIMFFFGT